MVAVKLAKIVAYLAHSGQVDKGGHPYIEHPLAVADLVSSPVAKVVALLHDVVEDTTISLDDLRAVGFSDEIIRAVDCITRREGESRPDYLSRVASNPISTAVKIADLTHNSDLTRISNRPLTSKDYARVERYKRERKLLENYGYNRRL